MGHKTDYSQRYQHEFHSRLKFGLVFFELGGFDVVSGLKTASQLWQPWSPFALPWQSADWRTNPPGHVRMCAVSNSLPIAANLATLMLYLTTFQTKKLVQNWNCKIGQKTNIGFHDSTIRETMGTIKGGGPRKSHYWQRRTWRPISHLPNNCLNYSQVILENILTK